MAALRETKMLDAHERIALARSVLAQAEAAHGKNVRTLGAPVLPVVDELAALLPGGGLQCGAVTVLQGSTALLLSLISRATQEGAWCAMVGFPTIGALAASESGVELSRLALVPDPGVQAGQVLAALVDGIDLIVVGPELKESNLRPAAQRQISARVKERGVVLISTRSWPGAKHNLQAEVLGWRGLGRGFGYLTKQDLILGRGGAPGGASSHINSPGRAPSNPSNNPGRAPSNAQNTASRPHLVHAHRQIRAEVSLPLGVPDA